MKVYPTLFPDCGPETCRLLPVWKGRSFGQYDPHGGDPAGYVEEHLLQAFLAWKQDTARERFEGGVYPTVDLDESADRWLFMEEGGIEPSYSSRPAFTAWWRNVLTDFKKRKRQPTLL